MSTLNSQRIRAGDHLPPLELPAAPHDEPLRLQTQGRDAAVILLLPSPMERWKEYLTMLAGSADDIEQWYARIVVVVSGELDAARRLREHAGGRLTVLADPGAGTHRDSGIDSAHAALLIVDRYGQVYEAIEAAQPDGLPAVADVEEWTKFLATQCPECGVIDEPGYGEWSLT